MSFEDRIAGTLLGTAVGDALGLPREGLSRRRAERIFGTGPLRHSLVLGRGMLSDDTEHTCMVAQALLACGGDPRNFARRLAWSLRWWLLRLPAGVGWATLRSILKLWLGFPASASGVHSAGNGPAMRSAILGACLQNDRDSLVAMNRAAARLTHRHPRAEQGALAIALAAAEAIHSEPADIDPPAVIEAIRSQMSDEELHHALAAVQQSLTANEPPVALAARLGLTSGVSGYIAHTVPMALGCWLHTPGDFRAAVESVIRLGGDSDTTGAITGALAGACNGAEAIPPEWLHTLVDWPLSVRWMRRLAARLDRRFGSRTEAAAARPVPLFWPGFLVRNPVFVAIVLCHGLRRLAPPY